MYLVVEVGSRVFETVVGGISRVDAIRHARRICAERGKPVRVRDQDAGDAPGAVLYTARPESNERRKAHECPEKCHGARRHQHSIKCRPARPACRWRRKAVGLCSCVAYHYPHRYGSGMCVEGRTGAERYETFLRTPRYRAA